MDDIIRDNAESRVTPNVETTLEILRDPAKWAGSSVGRTPRSQRGGRQFESAPVHHSASPFDG